MFDEHLSFQWMYPFCLAGLVSVSLLPYGYPHISVCSGPSPRIFSDRHSFQFKLLLPSLWLTFIVSSFKHMAFIFLCTAGVFSVGANRAWIFSYSSTRSAKLDYDIS